MRRVGIEETAEQSEVKNMPVACFLGRGRFPCRSDASHRDVDGSQVL